MDQKVKAKQPTSCAHLWTLLQQSRNELSEQYLMSLIERMPQIGSAFIDARGGYFDECKV